MKSSLLAVPGSSKITSHVCHIVCSFVNSAVRAASPLCVRAPSQHPPAGSALGLCTAPPSWASEFSLRDCDTALREVAGLFCTPPFA